MLALGNLAKKAEIQTLKH